LDLQPELTWNPIRAATLRRRAVMLGIAMGSIGISIAVGGQPVRGGESLTTTAALAPSGTLEATALLEPDLEPPGVVIGQPGTLEAIVDLQPD
jgi:hypothetical protein